MLQKRMLVSVVRCSTIVLTVIYYMYNSWPPIIGWLAAVLIYLFLILVDSTAVSEEEQRCVACLLSSFVILHFVLALYSLAKEQIITRTTR